MDDLKQIWGVHDNIGILEIAGRTAVMFVYLMVLLRFTGMRPFGKGNIFDNILTILLGAVLARGIVGATPFVSAMASGVVLVIIHFILSKITFFSRWLGRHIKGEKQLLYKDGDYVTDALQKTNVTKHDIEANLRIQCQMDSLAAIKEIYLERTGELSFVKKDAATEFKDENAG